MWYFTLPNTNGFNPELFPLDSKNHPALLAGVSYWVVAESPAPPGLDPVWALAHPTQGMYSATDFATGEWSPAFFGPVPAIIVEGTFGGGPGVPGDLNGDGVVGAADLAILLASWGACPAEGDCPADLNGDGTVGAADLAILLASWS